MTTQYTLDINHSTLLTSKQNADLVSCIKDTILNNVGLANLNKQIENNDIVSEILKLLATIIDSVSRNRHYLFDARTGEHIFYISEGSAKLPARIKDMITGIPKDRTSIRYYHDGKLFIMRVNSRFYPLSGVSKITSVPETLNTVFNGPMFIRRISERRFTKDSQEIWTFPVPTIRQTLSDLVEVVNTDIKRFWVRTKFSPPDALFITSTLLENLHTLMVVIRVNHNVNKFEGRRYSDSLALEALESGYNKFKSDKSYDDFIHTAIYLTGKILERLVVTDYQHLLKGFLK